MVHVVEVKNSALAMITYEMLLFLDGLFLGREVIIACVWRSLDFMDIWRSERSQSACQTQARIESNC